MPTRRSRSEQSEPEISLQLDAFDQAWQQGARPAIHDFLLSTDARDGAGRRQLLIELVALDLEYRWRHGSEPSEPAVTIDQVSAAEEVLPVRPLLEDYVRRYPDLGSLAKLPGELIAEEYRARRRFGDPPSPEEYAQRFGSGHESLPRLLASVDRQLETADHSLSPGSTVCGDLPRALKIRCPQCHHPVEILGHQKLGEITCPSCQSAFSLVGDATMQASEKPIPQKFGHFELLEQLGAGAFGAVWKARDMQLDRIVAVKIPRRTQLDAEDVEKFVREARAAAQLQHPNIVSVHEVGRESDKVYIVSDYISGLSLDQWLADQKLTPREAAERCGKIALALHHAHEAGVVHRDLKPSNIMIDAAGEPHVMDFGLAKREAGEITMTMEGQILGTPAYMSPEQAKGEGHAADRRSDVYSLGVILFELLTGERPFRGNVRMLLKQVVEDEPPSPRKLDSRIPRDLETICLKCLEKEPSNRYSTAIALANDLARFQTGEPILAHPITRWERALKWSKRRPLAATLIVVSALAILGIGTGGFLYGQNANQRARLSEWEFREQVSFARLRIEVQQLITSGQEARGSGNLQDARVHLSAAKAKIGTESRLVSELARVERLRSDVQQSLEKKAARARVQNQLREFMHWRDAALFYGSQYTGLDETANLRATRDAAERALAVTGISEHGEDAPLLNSAYLSEHEKSVLKIGGYEVLLTLAGALAKYGPTDNAPRDQLSQALQVLDRAQHVLGRSTRTYHLHRARFLDQQGKPLEAVAERDQAVASDAEAATPVDYFLAGKLLMDSQDSEQLNQAIEEFENTLRLDANHFWSEYFIALCQLRLQRPDLAKAHLTACVGRRPDFVWIYILKGLVHGELGEFRRAEADFRKAEDLNLDENARHILLVNRGVMRFRKGTLTEAENDLQQAIDLKPAEFQAYVNLAQVFQSQKRYGKAEERFSQALRLQPGLAAVYRSRGAMRLEQRRLPAALEDFESAIRCATDGDHHQAADYTQVGRILDIQGQFKASFDAYQAALAIDPEFSLAHLFRAQLLLEQKQFRQAVNSLDAYLRGGERTADAYLLRGAARAALGDYPGSIDDYSRALEFQPSSANYARRGWAYTINDAPKIALPDFDEAIRLDPANGDAYNGRGLTRVLRGDVDLALTDAENALRYGKPTPRTMFNAARIFALAAERLRTKLSVGQIDGQGMEPVRECENRAVQLLHKSLELLPSEDRSGFWQDYVTSDQRFSSLRRNLDFLALQTNVLKD